MTTTATAPSAPYLALHAQPPLALLQGRDLTSLGDLTPPELMHLLAEALAWKRGLRRGLPLAGKTLGLVFRKHSTRTRVSAEVAMAHLGGQALFLHDSQTQLGRGEPLADTARVLSRYVDGLFVRTFAHAEVVEWARWADVPVINALTDADHPCQALADLLTLAEHTGRAAALAAGRTDALHGLHLTYIGDGNNMAHALMLAGALAGMVVRVATPPGFEPDVQVLAQAKRLAQQTGAVVKIGHDPRAAAVGAHAVYTDVWASMGQEDEAQARKEAFAGFAVDESLMAATREDAVFMHCLPAHRGEEVSEGVLEGPQSVVFEQAENRLHTIKAVLAALL